VIIIFLVGLSPMLQAPIDSALNDTHLVSVSLERGLAETFAKS
jgi:hypothetical protein